MTRRELLAAMAALPVVAQAPSGAQTRTPKFADYPFQLGVASGEPDPHGFVLWTRLAPKPLVGGGMPGGAMGAMPDLADIDPKALAQMQQQMGKGLPGLGKGLPGLGAGLPGLGSPFGKKK